MVPNPKDSNLYVYDANGSASILLEPQRTNVLLNTATLSTQAVTTTAVSYALSFYGTGTITLSGAFVGTLVGTGVSNRVSLVFTSTAAPLTLTVSGSVANAQLEVGAYATSYIPTIGTSLTRNQDTIEKTSVGSDILNASEGTFYAEIAALANDLTLRQISISDGTNTNKVLIRYHSLSNTIRFLTNTTALYAVIVTVTDVTSFNKCLIKYGSAGLFAFVNGVKYTLALVSGTGTGIPTTLNSIKFSDFDGTGVFQGNCKGLQIYKTALTDAECTSLTTL
jgi:hypothetical protein